MEELLSSNCKNWIIVRPGVLAAKPAKGHYRYATYNWATTHRFPNQGAHPRLLPQPGGGVNHYDLYPGQ